MIIFYKEQVHPFLHQNMLEQFQKSNEASCIFSVLELISFLLPESQYIKSQILVQKLTETIATDQKPMK